MMKKKIGIAVSALALTLCMSIPAFAGQWQHNTGGWRYQNDDGGYPADTWQWIEAVSYTHLDVYKRHLVGLTVVALGTSLPELVTSVVPPAKAKTAWPWAM